MKTPQEVAREFQEFRDTHDGTDYTFGHIVIADFNISRGHIVGCFETDNMKQWATEKIINGDNDFDEIEEHYLDTAETIKFLRYLLDYDDEFLEQVSEILLSDE